MDDLTGEVSVLSDFDLAAMACGHDTTTAAGRSGARHDYRVWDLLDAWAVEEHIANDIASARRAIANSTQRSW